MRIDSWLADTLIMALVIGLLFAGTVSSDVIAQVCVQTPKSNLLNPITTSGTFPNGESLAASGDAVLVGIESNAELGKGVWVMRKRDSDWTIEQKIYAPAGAAGFGAVLAMHNDVAVIGAPLEAGNAGAVYVYRFNGTQWSYEAKLVSPDAAADDKFGLAISVSGNVIVIGAPFEDEGVPVWLDHGYAYAFRFDGTTWQFEQKFAPDEVVYSQKGKFGRTVAIQGDTAAVGSETKGTHFYAFDGKQWTHKQAIPLNAASVALDAERLVVGVPSPSAPGAAYVYEMDANQWVQTAQLAAFDATPNKDDFGRAVAMNGDAIIVGAPYKRLMNPGPDYNESGAAYAFRSLGGTWDGDRKFVFRKSFYYGWFGDQYLHFGNPVALADSSVLFGVPLATWFYQGAHGTAVAFDHGVDCNSNESIDFCEVPDCNGNQTPDSCDLDNGASSDCNTNAVPDECEMGWAYSLDNGIGTTAWGIPEQPVLTDLLWMNQFNVIPGCQTVDVIGIMWKDIYRAGMPVTVLLYDDPDGDGDPEDAVLLARADVLSRDGEPGSTTTKIERVRIDPTYIGPPGHSFFVAAKATCWNYSYPAASEWSIPGLGRSWTLGTNTPMNLKTPGKSYLGKSNLDNFILRAGTFDCNGNNIWDGCDINTGFSLDANNNGIPDECDGSCIADLSPPQKGNGIVDVDDLLVLINAWGQCDPKQLCPADIAPLGKPNGVVDIDDLLELINNWGPCT